MKYIYKVKCHYVSELDFDGNIRSDMNINTFEIGLFSSLKRAEKSIQRYLNVTFMKNDIIGFNVEKRQIDAKIYHFDALYSYDRNGYRICASEYDELCKVKFTGRSKDIHFKPNDIVWYANDNEAFPVMITDIPISKCKGGDYSDDCYTVVSIKDGHFHPHVTSIFPLNGEVDNKTKMKLQKQFKYYNLNGF